MCAAIKGLFHSPEVFLRESYETRKEKYGFRNIERLELFLWDLELFLQIQKIFGDRIVLKGGAAVQFYLPIEAQRTSVDIDMLFDGSKEEIDQALAEIYEKLGSGDNLFRFEPYHPKNPKTELPLFTYFVNIPSVLSEKELLYTQRTETQERAQRELKIEFITGVEGFTVSKTRGINIFAVESPSYYNLLPFNELFADKLTTLGAQTVGVQEERKDEQVKQFYDIWMLLQHNLESIDIKEVQVKYWDRVRQECERRKIMFDKEYVAADVLKQLEAYAEIDIVKDSSLNKYVDAFKGLYLNSKVVFSAGTVACAAEQIRLLYSCLIENAPDIEMIKTAYLLSKLVALKDFTGTGKGEIVKALRQLLIERFASYSRVEAKALKGKSPERIFWSVANKDNISDIKHAVEEYLKTNN